MTKEEARMRAYGHIYRIVAENAWPEEKEIRAEMDKILAAMLTAFEAMRESGVK